ncbi:hypothetical protein GGR57DRAFT_516348 [Xylariaceae sp. FL1272]|nr:hypothetical protein GGR57DRAFT_516348 [Xylariaceae sp. FL1272]
MANLRNTVMKLLESDDYSDCALICGDERIKLHQAIVCPQSRVLSAAFSSNMQEGKTEEMKCEFSAEVVLAMRDYMYLGYYAPPANFSNTVNITMTDLSSLDSYKQTSTELKYIEPQAATTTASSSSPTDESANGDGAAAGSSTEDKRTAQIYDDFSSALAFYANLSIAADYYDVGGLIKSTVEKIKTLLDHPQCPIEAFRDLLETTAACRGDKELRHLIISHCAQNISSLYSKGVFIDDGMAADLTPDIFQLLLPMFQESEKKNKQSEDTIKQIKSKHEAERAAFNQKWRSEKERLTNLYAAERMTHERAAQSFENNLKELAGVLQNTRGCCKRECPAIFNCTIQKPEHNDEKRYLIRCLQCKCRHTYDAKTNTASLAAPPKFT